MSEGCGWRSSPAASTPKGKIGEDTAALLGALLDSRTGLAAMSRAGRPDA